MSDKPIKTTAPKPRITFKHFSPNITPEYKELIKKYAESQKRIAKLGNYK